MTGFTDVFGGSPTQPQDVSYNALSLSANTTLSWTTDSPNTNAPLTRILDVTPTNGGYSIMLPSALNAGVGADTLFRNLGVSSFNVLNHAGLAVATVAAGQIYYFYLTNNTTDGGSWGSLLFGASSSQLSAASVASNSIIATAGALVAAIPVTTLSSTYTVVAGDRGSQFVWTGGAGVIDITSAATLGNNFFFSIKNAGTGSVALTPLSSYLIDGGTTVTLAPNESCIVTCSGAAFYSLGYGRSTVFSYSKTTKSVAGGSNVTLIASEYSNAIINFTGLLTANINVVFPAVANIWFVNNNTTGAFTLTCITAGGTGLLVPQGTNVVIEGDGVNIVSAVSGAAGTVTSVATGAGLVGGPITTSGTISLAATTVTAGFYPHSGVTFNAYGQATANDEVTAHNAPIWYR